jgi:uncharacterized membrane protein YgcG
MSAQDGAPALGRAQIAPTDQWNARQGSSIPMASVPARFTRRAMTVAAATLCAPLVAVAGLAAIGVAGGGGDPAVGTMAGSQGLRGTTVETIPPAPAQVAGPTDPVFKREGKGEAPTAAASGRPVKGTTDDAGREPATDLRAPAHKPPIRTQPRTPSRRVSPAPPPAAPEQIVDPSAPGAPTTSGGATGSGGTTGPGDSSGPGSGTGSGSGGGSGSSEGDESSDGGD